MAELILSFIKTLIIPIGIYHFAMALALFWMARDQKLPLSWLAWLPIGQEYVLGSIADSIGGGNDRFFRRGESYYRHILACLQIVSVFYVAMTAVMSNRGVNLSEMLFQGQAGQLFSAVFEIASFAVTAIRVYVYYLIFGWYRPERAVIYTLICVFLSPLTPVMLFLVQRSRFQRGRKRSRNDGSHPSPPDDFDR